MGLARGSQRSKWGRLAVAAVGLGLSFALAAPAQAQPLPMPPVPPSPSPTTPGQPRLSDPSVVNYAVLSEEQVGRILDARMTWERFFNSPYVPYTVDNAACNNYAGIGLPEVFNDPGLAAFRGADTMTGPNNDTHFTRQVVGVYGTVDQADWAFRRVSDRTFGCSGQTTTVHYDTGESKTWTYTRGPSTATDAAWFAQRQSGPNRQCYFETRRRQNVLLQAMVCEAGNAGPSVNALATAMQNMLFQQ